MGEIVLALNTRRSQTLFLLVVVVAYLVIGALYAALTPEWQVPDEPAHYNYVRQLAAGRLPVIEPADYDQDYLESLKTNGFPAEQAIDSIQYEDHQPPLYYLLATPIFWLSGGSLVSLRMFSVLLGAGVIGTTFLVTRRLFPTRPFAVLVTLSVVAFVPQHIAMMAGVNNDSLAELLVALALYCSVLVLSEEHPPSPWLLGFLLGAVLITKIQAYVVVPVLGLAGLIRWRRDPASGWKAYATWLLRVYGPALLIGGIWWTRNVITYGGWDWMGLERHDLVVAGQPTTAGWIADYGIVATIRRFFQFTFQSFWGMFGWMAVPMSGRVYQALGIWSAATACGCVLAFQRRRKRTVPDAAAAVPISGWTSLLLATSAALTMAGYLWWNLRYVQHQGRYLFPALIPIAAAAGVAWNQLTLRNSARLTACVLVVTSLGVAAANRWAAALWAGAAGLLWLGSLLSPRKRWLLPGGVAVGLALLSGASLFVYVLRWLN